MLMKGKLFKGLFACWLLSLASFTTEAADIVTAQSGSWTSSSTWVGGVVPTQGDQATIKAGHTITIPSTGTKSCTNLLVESGGKLYANTGGSQRYVDIYGNITCNGTIGNGSVNDGISFNIEGAACLISGSGTFDASRIRKNTSLYSTGTLTVSMNVNLRYNGTAILNNKSATNFHIIIEAGSTLNCMGNSGIPGNICIDGSNASNGSSYGGSITVNGTLTVSGILYLTTDNNSSTYSVSCIINSGGVVNTASVICTNSGNAGHFTTISNGGKLNFTSGDWGTIGMTNNSYAFTQASTIEYSGTAAQNVGNPSAYGNLIISGGADKTVSPGDLTINGDLDIANSCCLVIPRSRAVTVQGNLILGSADGLVLKAGDAVSAPGSFICNGGINGSGTVKVEKFISGYLAPDDANYHLLLSPVSPQNIQPEFVADPPDHTTDFYRWDEPGGIWVNSKTSGGSWNTSFQPGDDRTFIKGRGYLIASSSDVVRNFSGNISNSNLDVQMSYTQGDYAGYNLVGNPYTSALNADINNWSKINTEDAVWVWDPASGNYRTWNGSAGTLQGGIIPAMQGFFVKATGPLPSLSIPASSRVHSSLPAYKSITALELHISLSGGAYCDETVLYTSRTQPGMHDTMHNVGKFMGFRDAPQLYFIEGGSFFSIFQGDTLSGNWVIPLGIRKGFTDTLSLEFSGIETFSGEDAFYLEDRLEGRNINLREVTSYEFASRQAVENERFFIHYKNTTGTYTSSVGDKVRMYAMAGGLRIEGLEDFTGNEILEIFDMDGRKVVEKHIPPRQSLVPLDLDPGCYIVRLSLGKAGISKKLLFTK